MPSAALATTDGKVRGLGFADGANFQGCGVRTAQTQIDLAIKGAMKAADFLRGTPLRPPLRFT